MRMRDDLGRDVILHHPARRIVSLVPSDTLSLFALGLGERIVGRTEYCVDPREKVDAVPTCGGTKSVDIDKVLALAPDLVVANQEENTRPVLEALAQRGVTVFVSFPRRVGDAVAHLARLARMGGVERDPAVVELIRCGYAVVRDAASQTRERVPTILVPIWNDPWMTLSADTYASDLLAAAGGRNAFSDRVRNYPLAADLGKIEPFTGKEVVGRDTRYPRIRLEEVIERAPDIVLLPDEPYAFTAEDAAIFAGLDIPAAKTGAIRHVSGMDLFWHGAHTVEALPRMAALIAELAYN